MVLVPSVGVVNAQLFSAHKYHRGGRVAAITLRFRSETRANSLRGGTADQDAGSRIGSNLCFQSVEVPEAMMARARSSGEVRSG